jgi:hypothetical protein
MPDSPNPIPPTIAPADARPHRPWSRPAKIAAYAILTLLAFASIWFINRRVDRLVNDATMGVGR